MDGSGNTTSGQTAKRTDKRHSYAFLNGRNNGLERSDFRFRWGHYGFRILRFHWTTFQPSKVIGFHKHDEYEFHFIPRGKGVVIMDDIAHPVHEGMFYLTGPDVEHYQEADEREGMDELCLHLDIVRLDESGEEAVPAGEPDAAGWGADAEIREADECVRLLKRLPRKPAADRFDAMDCFATAFLAWTENETGLYTTIKQAVIQILLRSVRAYGTSRGERSIPARDMNAYRLQLARRFIEANWMRPITLEDVAEKIRISGRQLQRIFRDNGMGSFSEYVETVRLERVCHSLAASREPIEHIALTHGYSSSNYFYHVFRRRFGTTPGAYRASKQNEKERAK